MKTILLSFMMLCILSCHKSEPDPIQEPLQKYFNPDDLSKLSLDSVSNFWGNSTFKIDNNFFPYLINPEENNKGIRYHSKNDGLNKDIGVCVFESQEKAIAGMRFRINNVAAIIVEGDSNESFPGQWWYYNGSEIFINQWNTIIEVMIIPSEYTTVEKDMMNTAIEIASRIDKLSSTIK